MIVQKLTPDEWKTLSQLAHGVCFNEDMPKDLERISFALLALDDDNQMVAYQTCVERDSETIYWQYGGSFPGYRGTVKSFAAYQAFARWHIERYKRITTYIENTNLVMLKMAMKIGFRIQGLRIFKGSILLEHLLEG